MVVITHADLVEISYFDDSIKAHETLLFKKLTHISFWYFNVGVGLAHVRIKKSYSSSIF